MTSHERTVELGRTNYSATAASKGAGFTLIELIIVIVILGILAVVAAPQFFNFGSDARAATVRGLEGSVKTASELVHARAQLRQVDANGDATANGGYILVRAYGTPVKLAPNTMFAEASENGIWNALSLSEEDWGFQTTPEAGSTTIIIFPKSLNDSDGCNVTYAYNPTEGPQPRIESSVEKC